MVWSVTDPRDGKRVALKKLPNVFQSLVSSKRVFRELKMMRFFKHENVLSCLDILQVKTHCKYVSHYVTSSCSAIHARYTCRLWALVRNMVTEAWNVGYKARPESGGAV